MLKLLLSGYEQSNRWGARNLETMVARWWRVTIFVTVTNHRAEVLGLIRRALATFTDLHLESF